MKKLIFLIISVILLTGCSTAIAKNNDVVETTKKQEVQNTTTEVKQETTATIKETVAQEKKSYSQSEYESYFKTDYYQDEFVSLSVNGDLITVISSYDGVTKSESFYKAQVDAILDMKKAGTQLTKKIKSSEILGSNNRALVSYVLQANGQTVTFPENSRPIIPQYSLGKYVAEMHARGQEVTTTNARTGIELIKENNERNAQIIAEHNEYMAQQDELFAEIHAEHEERDAESRAEAQENAANRKAFKSVALNAYAEIGKILSKYATYSSNLAGRDIGADIEANVAKGLTKNDTSMRTITINGKAAYRLPVSVLPEAREECLPIIDAAINELENFAYGEGIKEATAQNAKGQIKELNNLKAKMY